MRNAVMLLGIFVGFLMVAQAGAQTVEELKQSVERLQAENAQLKTDMESLTVENKRLRVLAGLVEPEDRALAQERKLETQTDESGRITRATSNPMELIITGGSRADHEIHLRYENDQPILEIRGFYSRGIYRDVKSMELKVNDTPMSITVSNYRSKRQDFGTRVNINADDEFLTLNLTREQVAAIGKAGSVSGKLGRMTFRLTQDQIALFRALDARLGQQ